jgi:hypothetical protein
MLRGKCVAVTKKSEDHHDMLRGWFLWLDNILRKNWTIMIKEFDSDNLLQDEIDGDYVDCILKGSHGTVFYIAGYLLLWYIIHGEKMKKKSRKSCDQKIHFQQ